MLWGHHGTHCSADADDLLNENLVREIGIGGNSRLEAGDKDGQRAGVLAAVALLVTPAAAASSSSLAVSAAHRAVVASDRGTLRRMQPM